MLWHNNNLYKLEAHPWIKESFFEYKLRYYFTEFQWKRNIYSYFNVLGFEVLNFISKSKIEHDTNLLILVVFSFYKISINDMNIFTIAC